MRRSRNVEAGHFHHFRDLGCDDIPAAADGATLDELLAKISAMALDLLPDNHPDVDPASLFLQITPLREVGLVAV